MLPLPTAVDTSSPTFVANAAAMRQQLDRLREELRIAAEDRSARAISRHKEQGKLTAAERVQKLLDPGSPFLEIGALTARGMYDDGKVHKAGTLAGIGVVSGRTVMISASDATVKGGTVYPMGVKKALRLQHISMENRLPFISLVDSGGAYLPLQSEVFPDVDDGGRIFYNQAWMSRMGIPQLTGVMGLCTGGAAYIPAMSDEVVQVRGTGAIFLGGPPLVKAATGEDVTAEELGGVEVHCGLSGVSDYLAENDEEAIEMLRRMAEKLPGQGLPRPQRASRPPLYDPQEIYGIVPPRPSQPYDVREVIARVVDGSEFEEFRASFGSTLVTGWAYIHGYLVGILANNGVLFSESAQKATHFIQICDKRGIPLVFLQNISGFMIGRDYERAGITKHGQQMVTAVSTATVPKFTCIIGGSFGAGNYAMCGRAYGPRFLWSWPNAQIGVMGGEQAANVLISVQNAQRARAGEPPIPVEEEEMIREPIVENSLREGDAWYSTAQLWDDGIIDPAKTRDVLGLCLGVAARNEQPGFGIFRT
ncbi:MAG TPA: carboxyl transferase domain-containing protein [Myxococcota bacterium]|nr:carboxyl transferase domain-containing protein [Myxococcota bacterium]